MSAIYDEFIRSKIHSFTPSAFAIEPQELSDRLFPFQRDCVQLALSRGKFCLWSHMGLGKTIQQLEWARIVTQKTGGKVLVLAPLGVASQTVREGAKFAIPVTYCKNQSEAQSASTSIIITNYERLENFDTTQYVGVVLDESSVLKDYTSSTRDLVIDSFRSTPYKLACSATPSPNDWMELGNQAEFLGVMSRTEMLAMFFTHDGGDTSKWRLKGHAKAKFWEWVATWAIMIRNPSDLGYSSEGYNLPLMHIHEHMLDTHIAPPEGHLFWVEPLSLSDQRIVSKLSMPYRVATAAAIANSTNEQYLVWCEGNSESSLLKKSIQGAVEVKGSDSPESKERAMTGFANGEIRVLVTKPSIAGLGLNFQICHNAIYCGLSHSFERFYQSMGRIHRFGQTNEVHIHLVFHQYESSVLSNLRRKQKGAEEMYLGMVKAMEHVSMAALKGLQPDRAEYNPQVPMIIPDWLRSDIPQKDVEAA